ncbi:phosphatidylinositol-4-phosphate 5-kinase [Pelomyxa schiedti]|nr:phosphatidylinositol-4-phosphate 5-kinase [Pelomyxa schiedti]
MNGSATTPSYDKSFLITGSCAFKGDQMADLAQQQEKAGDLASACRSYFQAVNLMRSSIKTETWLGSEAKAYLALRMEVCLDKAVPILERVEVECRKQKEKQNGQPPSIYAHKAPITTQHITAKPVHIASPHQATANAVSPTARPEIHRNTGPPIPQPSSEHTTTPTNVAHQPLLYPSPHHTRSASSPVMITAHTMALKQNAESHYSPSTPPDVYSSPQHLLTPAPPTTPSSLFLPPTYNAISSPNTGFPPSIPLAAPPYYQFPSLSNLTLDPGVPLVPLSLPTMDTLSSPTFSGEVPYISTPPSTMYPSQPYNPCLTPSLYPPLTLRPSPMPSPTLPQFAPQLPQQTVPPNLFVTVPRQPVTASSFTPTPTETNPLQPTWTNTSPIDDDLLKKSVLADAELMMSCVSDNLRDTFSVETNTPSAEVQNSDFPQDCLDRSALLSKTPPVKDKLVYMVINGIRNSVVTENSKFSETVTVYRVNTTRLPNYMQTPDIKASDYNFDFHGYHLSIFKALRELSGITNSNFLESFNFTGPSKKTGLYELRSPGKSGSFFYGTTDMRFILKTINEEEQHTLTAGLHDYFCHLNSNPNSLLVRFYGLFSIHHDNLVMRFIVMENIFPPQKYLVHQRFDIKGSTVGREASVADLQASTPVLKDLDLLNSRTRLHLGTNTKGLFLKALFSDCTWLEKHQIMDYSFLVGIHTCSANGCCALANTSETMASRRSIFHSEEGGVAAEGTPSRTIYYIGIIDLLQKWTVRKRAENTLRRLISKDPEGLSCVDPVFYRQRFEHFVQQALD